MVVGATMAAEEEEEAEATEDVDVRVGVGCGDEDGDTTLVNDIVGSTDVGQISNALLYQVIEQQSMVFLAKLKILGRICVCVFFFLAISLTVPTMLAT